MTLPERTLKGLAAIDQDRGKAIVKATDAMLSGATRPGATLVKVAEVSPGTAVIVVGPSAALRRIAWLRLVEIAPSRFLLAIPSGTREEQLELAVLDQLDSLGPGDGRERKLLSELRDVIRSFRIGDQIQKSEIILLSLHPRRRVAGKPVRPCVRKEDTES